jgi:hypothetical protein
MYITSLLAHEASRSRWIATALFVILLQAMLAVVVRTDRDARGEPQRESPPPQTAMAAPAGLIAS